MRWWGMLVLAALASTGCGNGITDAVTELQTAPAPGAVFTTTNADSANFVVVFARTAAGGLARVDSVATGGRGSGPDPMFGTDPLGSQDAVILSNDNRLLFVVNAGSDEISSFRVATNGSLTLASRVASGGSFPVSLSFRAGLLYVVNGKGDANISGFQVAADGTLTPLAGSTRALPGSDQGPGSIRIRPDGRAIVVTERMTNHLDVFPLSAQGLTSAPTVMSSPGLTPFGADFDASGHYILSEGHVLPPRNPVPNAGTVSSFASSGSTLSVVTASAPTHQTAPCWIQITPDGRFAYTTNTGSGSITGFSIGGGGALTALSADGRTGLTGPNTQPLDMAFARGLLFAVTPGDGGIHGFRVGTSGSLSTLPAVTGVLPVSVEGLAAF